MLICFAVLGPALFPTAKADEWDKKTVVTFSGRVKVENTTLPAGTYVFKLMSGSGDRHVVQIFDKDETKLYATVLAVAASRVEPSEDTEITFADTSSSGNRHEGVVPRGGMPIKQWFYPGDTTGQEFPMQTASSNSSEARSAAIRMPETASSLPLIGLLGLFSLSFATGLHLLQRQRA
jgi:hypothetical protein